MSNKRIAITAGLLFLVSTASFMLGDALISTTSDYQRISGVLLQLLNSVFVLGIGIVLFPVVKQRNEMAALAYVVTRLVEAVILAVGAISPLVVLGLNHDAAPYAQTLTELSYRMHSLSFSTAMVFLGAGSVVFCYVLYQSRMIPRVISAIGLLGYVFLIVNAVSELFGNSMQMGLLLPGAIFELVFPIWLLVKGFNTSPIQPLLFTQREGI